MADFLSKNLFSGSIFMKNRLFSGICAALVLAAVSFAGPAHADHARRGGALAGTTLLQIRNGTPEYITNITAVQHSLFFAPSAQNLLHGVVRPGSTVVVNFPSCYSDIHVATQSSPHSPPVMHSIYNFNVCSHTSYTINGWSAW